ncbi:hypothetical protein BKA62DRAFT_708353 [Auriculariales sp. MPI-PUGE-AT-0066]|nr:hypothetical protein BKA62DRAFT_708353 [Auriculariales sp. MPI-PUGE-AT-0066]
MPSPPVSRSPSRLDAIAGMPKRMMSLLLGNQDRGHSVAQAARAAGRPCLEWLPDELWLSVFEHLEALRDLRRLALVSRAMYAKVLPTLYRNVVVAWADPEQMYSMLCLLARDDFLASCVRSLVFDDDPSKYGRIALNADDVRRDFYREENLITTRRNLDDKELDRARTVLYRVLPTMTSLREVVLARTHPLLFSASAWVKQAPPQETSRIGRFLNPMRRRLRLRQSSMAAEEVFHRATGTDLWSTLFKRKSKSPTSGPLIRITRLVAPLAIPRTPQQKSHLAALTSLTLHHIRLVPDDKNCVKRWNKALRASKSLRKLALLDISSGPTLLTQCTFPHLEQFEATGLPSRSLERNAMLAKFLSAHAETLQIIAIQLNPARSNSPFWTGCWLNAPEQFVRLHTLRLEIIPRSHATGWYAEACPAHGPEHVDTWGNIFRFVTRCTTITDLALSGAPLAESQALKAELKASRRMRRMLLGNKLVHSFETHVGPNCVYGIPWKRAVYRFRFALQHWAFYNILFDGLELSRSGYVPSPRRE